MKYDLLPCPFCASNNLSLVEADSDSYVCCHGCGTFGPIPGDTGEEYEAVALWNQRLDSEREPDE